MKKSLIPVALLAVIAVGGCKTSEANYRAAYERAVENRTDIDSTIYGGQRRSIDTRQLTFDGQTFDVKTRMVSVTEDGGGIREYLRPYNVVVGQFKQLFNAQSLRNRLADNGYPRAFIVQTGEPYYYIILSSHDTDTEAARAIVELRAADKFPVVMRSPLPYILHAPIRR
ncbi:MAG: SPOR domain-containing protein [Bacteroidales bacterium]|nr:SPOR domain-containing protein [Bacteroidales bacterium]